MTHTISENMSVRPFVRPSVHNQMQNSHMPICGNGRGQQEMPNVMISKVIRGQGQGHGSVKFAKMAEFKVASAICRGILNVVDDYDTTGQYLNFLENFLEPDFPLSLSFSFYGTSKFRRPSDSPKSVTGSHGADRKVHFD